MFFSHITSLYINRLYRPKFGDFLFYLQDRKDVHVILEYLINPRHESFRRQVHQVYADTMISLLNIQEKAALASDDFPKNYSLVLEVGLEPTKPYGGRFTVSCDCHYTIPAYHGADSRTRTEDLLFTKQLL